MLGVGRNTVRRALAAEGPPRYRRPTRGSAVDAVEPQIRGLLAARPDMPATVIAERMGWSRGLTILKERVRELRPVYVPPDPASRTVYQPGELAQCDLSSQLSLSRRSAGQRAQNACGPPTWYARYGRPMSPGSGKVRAAAVIVGLILLAVVFGAVVALFASSGRVFLVAAVVTAFVAFVGGVLAEPVLRRWVVRSRRGGQVELEVGRRS